MGEKKLIIAKKKKKKKKKLNLEVVFPYSALTTQLALRDMKP